MTRFLFAGFLALFAQTAFADDAITRTYSLDDGHATGYAALDISRIGTLDPPRDSEALRAGLAYGIAPELTLGIEAAVLDAPDAPRASTATAYGILTLLRGERGSLALVVDGVLPQPGMKQVGVGLAGKLLLSRNVALYTGQPPGVAPIDSQLTIFMPEGEGWHSYLHLPVGLAVQLTPQLYTYADATLVCDDLTNHVTMSIADHDAVLPVRVGATYDVSDRVSLAGALASDTWMLRGHPGTRSVSLGILVRL